MQHGWSLTAPGGGWLGGVVGFIGWGCGLNVAYGVGMETGPVHDHTLWTRHDASAPGVRVPAVEAGERWPAYGDYLRTQNRRLGALADELRDRGGSGRGGGAVRERDSLDLRGSGGIRLGDVPDTAPRERAKSARVQTVQQRLAPAGRFVDVLA